MKVDQTHLSSYSKLKGTTLEAQKREIPRALLGKPNLIDPDYKLDLSKGASSLEAPPLPSTSVLPSLPSAPSLSSSSPKISDSSVVEKGEEKLRDKIKEKALQEATKEVNQVETKSPPTGGIKKPLVVFIQGLDLFSHPLKSEGGYSGVGRMADSISGAKVFSHDQKTEIKEEINKIHRDYPVILVGHSLGGDTAVEICHEYDSLKGGFRPIELLITMDAVGLNNDIIPQNVQEHLNVFGEKSWILNDGPHVARREEKTQVRNILSPLAHTDIDDDKEIQYEVINLIKKAMSKKPEGPGMI